MGRGLWFTGLAPQGVTVAARLPAATSLGCSCAWTLLFGNSELFSVLQEQNSCFKTKQFFPPLLNLAVYFKSTGIVAACTYGSLCESQLGLSCLVCCLQGVLFPLRGSLAVDRDRDQGSDAAIWTLHRFVICLILGYGFKSLSSVPAGSYLIAGLCWTSLKNDGLSACFLKKSS